jgi:hypothetical protein
VLSGVLLHVLEPSRPVDLASHVTRLDFTFNDVKDLAVVPVDDIDDPRGAESASVERLPS